MNKRNWTQTCFLKREQGVGQLQFWQHISSSIWLLEHHKCMGREDNLAWIGKVMGFVRKLQPLWFLSFLFFFMLQQKINKELTTLALLFLWLSCLTCGVIVLPYFCYSFVFASGASRGIWEEDVYMFKINEILVGNRDVACTITTKKMNDLSYCSYFDFGGRNIQANGKWILIVVK